MEYHLKKVLGNVGTRTCVAGYQSTALPPTRPSCFLKNGNIKSRVATSPHVAKEFFQMIFHKYC